LIPFNQDGDARAASSATMQMQDDTLELLISIGHYARVHDASTRRAICLSGSRCCIRSGLFHTSGWA
jgi:hypothetical protein